MDSSLPRRCSLEIAPAAPAQSAHHARAKSGQATLLSPTRSQPLRHLGSPVAHPAWRELMVRSPHTNLPLTLCPAVPDTQDIENGLREELRRGRNQHTAFGRPSTAAPRAVKTEPGVPQGSAAKQNVEWGDKLRQLIHPAGFNKAAVEKFTHDDMLKERSKRGKRNYEGETSGRGPSKYRGGLLERELKRQPHPANLYKRLKVDEEDGTILERFHENTHQVQMGHADAIELPRDELVESTNDVDGASRRTGSPHLYAAASLGEGSQFHVTRSEPSITSRRPPSSQLPAKEDVMPVSEDVIRRIAEMTMNALRVEINALRDAVAEIADKLSSYYSKPSGSKRKRPKKDT